MFTRHFYRYDVTRAALLCAISKGRALETAFWVQELLDSGLADELWATLVEAWLWFCLAADPHWITDRCEAEPHLAAYRLAIGPKDNSLWAVLCLNHQEMPDTLCANVPRSMPYTKPGLEKYLHIALHQQKGAAAFWAARRLRGGGLEPLSLSPLIGVPEDVHICATVLWLCSQGVGRPVVAMNADVDRHVKRWSSRIGRRNRRELAIPVECLYGLTARGCSHQKETTIGELRGIHDVLAEEIMGDDALEAFYAATFPDDIPDEWSLECQERSHGLGVLRTGERLSLAKLGRIWFQAESRFAWGFYEWAGEDRIMEEGLLDFQQVGENLNTDDCKLVDALLEPVRKLLIID